MYKIIETSSSKTYFLKSLSPVMGGTFTLNEDEALQYATMAAAQAEIDIHMKAMPKSCMNKLSIC